MPRPRKEAVAAKLEFWAGHLEACQRSGLSQGEYCRRHGLSQSSLGYWRSRLAKLPAKVADVAGTVTIVPVPFQVPVPAPEGSGPEPLLLHVDRRFQVEIRGDFRPAVLTKLLATLERL